MTIIPFAEALKLLDRAHDIHVPGYSETKSFSLDAAEGAYAFLELYLEKGDNEFFLRFLESANQTVKIEGDVMTLVCDDAVVADLPFEIEIKLTVPMVLEPSMGEVHEQQCLLESSLNRILEFCRDGYHPGEVRLHARAAKKAFDNFTSLRASQPEAVGEAELLQGDQEQHDRQDGADDPQGNAGDKHPEQPVNEGEDKGDEQDGQECGEHPAPYQAEEPPATDPFAIPPLVLQALRHVRAHIPDVDRVVFWGDGRWAYMTDAHKAPSFDGLLIDTSLLEDAAGDFPDCYPRAFQLPPEEE